MEEAFPFQKEPGIEKREKSAGGGAYGSTKNAIGRYRPQPPDEEKTQRRVQQISADIGFHDGSRISIPQLHRLQNESKGSEIHRQKSQGAVLHGQGQVIGRGAHED